MRCSLLILVALAGCREHKVGATAQTQPTVEAPRPAHGAGRDRYRGGGVYLDGVPIGMLRYGELPRAVQPIWETQQHRLPFRAGEPVRYRETRVPRFRVTDYLAALGVPLGEITEVHMLGGRDAALVLRGEDLRAHPDNILFKFSGNTSGKPIPQIRGVEVGTTFDDLAALTIYIKRPPPKLTPEHTLELDGHPVAGIPYHGQPMRGGIRVYLDDRMVAVLKRNELPASPGPLPAALARLGVDTGHVERMELIVDDSRTANLPWRPYELAFNAAASGEIVIDAQPATALALYTKR